MTLPHEATASIGPRRTRWRRSSWGASCRGRRRRGCGARIRLGQLLPRAAHAALAARAKRAPTHRRSVYPPAALLLKARDRSGLPEPFRSSMGRRVRWRRRPRAEQKRKTTALAYVPGALLRHATETLADMPRVGVTQSRFWLGLALLASGLVFAVWTTRVFVTAGQGTPVRWVPPNKLVVREPPPCPEPDDYERDRAARRGVSPPGLVASGGLCACLLLPQPALFRARVGGGT